MLQLRNTLQFMLRRLLPILFIALLLADLMPLHTFASEEPETLRVAFYPLEGFFAYDKNGNEVGYGVELLNKISQTSGIRFEYIPAPSWESTREMVLSGKADIRMPATAPSEPSTTLGYTTNPIETTSHCLMALADRDDLYYEDTETFATLRIGITPGMYQNLSFHEYLTMFGLTGDQLSYYDTYDDEYAALKNGEIDAVVSNIMDMKNDMKLLFRYDSVPNYISMTYGNPYLDYLDSAITQINTDEPDYLSNLNRKWFPGRNNIPLSKEETQYIKGIDSLTFAFSDNEGFLSHKQDDGSFAGFYPAIAEDICEKLSIPCNQVDVNDTPTADAVVIYPDFYFDYEWADDHNVSLSLPYFTVRYYEIAKRNIKLNNDMVKIAAVKNMRLLNDFYANGYEKSQMVWYENSEECIQAVEEGYADITFVSSYTAEYYLSLYRYADLSFSLSNYTHQVSFAVPQEKDDMMILTIMNKLLDSLTEEEKDQLLTEATANTPRQDLLQELLISSPITAIIVVGLISAALVTAVLMSIFARRMKRKNVTLQKATAAKSEFLSRMSHDIRTPLNVIIGMNKLAQDNDNPPDTNECLQKIDISSEFLLGLINDVLDMERVESGKEELHLAPYSSSDFRSYIETIFTPLCEQKGIHFEYHYDYTLPDTYGIMQDKLKINQIYFNLLSNAVKFTPEDGTIRFESKVSKQSNGKAHVCTIISDTGIGMSKEFQAHMYDAFAQENQVMHSVSQGTGLGLTIVKKMCDLMGMRISVKSELGKGTTYTLEGDFDIAKIESTGVSETTSDVKEIEISALKGKTILVCEDHQLNQEIIRRVLEKAGIIVDMAGDGKEGTTKFNKAPSGTYYAILMDIRMPIMNGLDATREIRSLKRRDAQTVPIIAMTANAYEEDIKASLDAGMNAHLAKPIDVPTLYRTLLQYLQ